ncbi:MAG: septal ring lytic transglycosylase RlpA family protein [Gammaproteobacteria bacterium]|nr:septal ring lytic transglycosylase RlpA family protein [Gammaproteobacteria bacterium]
MMTADSTRRNAVLAGLLVSLMMLVPACTSWRPAGTSTAAPPDYLPPGYKRSYVVFGKRYYVMNNGDGYHATGTASWYGPNFNGRPTASGEIYDMHQLTAAHKSLPLHTVVEVTNLENQRSVTVRINDRGPFIGDRLIDMSYGAAMALDMIGPGTVPVQVTAVDRPADDVAVTPATLPGASPAPAVPAASSFIQVGAFADPANARELAGQLELSGFDSVIIQEMLLNERPLQRVMIGPLSVSADHQLLLDKLAAMGLATARLVSH